MEEPAQPETPDDQLRLDLEVLVRFLLYHGGEDVLHAMREAKLNPTQLRLLHILARPHQRAPRVSRVGKLLELSGPSATRIVTSLAERHYVDRGPDDGDGRVRRVYITERGREVTQRIREAMVLRDQALFEHVSTARRRDLARALRPVAQSLEEG